MPKKRSAGLVVYRMHASRLEVLLVHPGGPFWQNKDEGAWSIPKGEYEEGEDALAVAKREFAEEVGLEIVGDFRPLPDQRQPSGKVISAWAVLADLDISHARSNTFRMEWPPKSGQMQEFPEVDKVAWFDMQTARRKILPGQRPFIEHLAQLRTS